SDSFFSDDKEVTVYEYEYDAAGNYTHMTVYFLYSIQDLEKENWKELATVESEETREIEYY
ncbi:MAG: membrane-binding protein, partial [Mesotoga sp.]|nr:membrane-binding protein [Mesotoga sp.]